MLIDTYEAYAPDIFNKAGALAAGGGIVGIIVAIAGSLWRARQNQLVMTYGSSRWASKDEISKSGLFNPSGVFLGRLNGNYLRHDGPEHVMCFAPTRSGKLFDNFKPETQKPLCFQSGVTGGSGLSLPTISYTNRNSISIKYRSVN